MRLQGDGHLLDKFFNDLLVYIMIVFFYLQIRGVGVYNMVIIIYSFVHNYTVFLLLLTWLS